MSEIQTGGIDTPQTAPTLGGRIQAARIARGLSAAQLARRTSVMSKTLNNWECDRSEPRPNKLQMVAGVLNVPLLWLLGADPKGLEFDFEPELDETANLKKKFERLVDLHERTSTLMFEVQSEISRLQSQIDKNAVNL